MEQDTIEKQEITTVSNALPEKIVKTTTKVSPPVIKTENPQRVFEKKKAIFRTYQVVWYILAVIEVILGFRITLKALGAYPLSGFTNLIYTMSDPLALPFTGVLGSTISGNAVFEWSTIIGALVYAVIAFGLVSLMQIVKPVTPKEVEQEVDDAS